jgi:hypothetical protein
VSELDDVVKLRLLEEDIQNALHKSLFPLYKPYVGPIVGEVWHVVGKPSLRCTVLGSTSWYDVPWVMFGMNRNKGQVFTMQRDKFIQFYSPTEQEKEKDVD